MDFMGDCHPQSMNPHENQQKIRVCYYCSKCSFNESLNSTRTILEESKKTHAHKRINVPLQNENEFRHLFAVIS